MRPKFRTFFQHYFHLKFFLLDMTSINNSLSEQGSEMIDGIIGADFLKKTNNKDLQINGKIYSNNTSILELNRY